jgi:folate-binding protein YgfZ
LELQSLLKFMLTLIESKPPDSHTREVYESLHHDAVAFCPAGRSQIELSGQDRTTFLHSFCTGDIKKLKPGQGCEAFITNHQGKAVGHVLVFCEEDRLLLDAASGQTEKIIKHLDRFLISERVEFKDHSQQWYEILVAGPNAEQMLRQVGVEKSFSQMLEQKTVNEVGLRLRKVDLLGDIPAFLLFSVKGLLDDTIGRLCALGCRDAVVEYSALHIARVEAGYPLYGIDITEDNLPQEVTRNEQAISFTKGCYLGQETIARLDALGHVNRILTGLKFPEGANPQPGEVIMQGDKKIAQITSVAYSPKLQAPLALAYVRSIHATPGKRIPYGDGEAEVVKLPL